jgi:hypothetical protein
MRKFLTQNGLLVGIIAFAFIAETAWAGGVYGHAARIPRIKGKDWMGYHEVYESNLFLSPPNNGTVGPSRRLGTWMFDGVQCTDGVITGDGQYCVDGMPGGSYSILVNQPEFFVRPSVLPYIVIPNSGRIVVDVDIPIDYSTYFADDWPGADKTWYQTFTATGINVTGVSFFLANAAAPQADVAILEDNGDPDVRNWTLVPSPNGTNPLIRGANPQRELQIGALTDNWVRWRSGELPTVPGRMYAVRITGRKTNGVEEFFVPFRRMKDGSSYEGGRAYNSQGIAQNFDLNYIVFSDNDGTIVTVSKRTNGVGDLIDGRFDFGWGQTFIAQGQSLAAADCWAAGANHHWDLEFMWRVREGGPDGDQIGPTKRTLGAFFSHGVGLHGVSYNPEEVPLVEGQTYFIEFIVSNPPADSNGFNPMFTDDAYDGGNAYRYNGSSWSTYAFDDIAMTIVEYKPTGAIIELSETAIERTVPLGHDLSNDAFTVRNGGGGCIDYTVWEGEDWLDRDPTTGVSCGEEDTITLMYDVASLPKDRYSTMVIVSDPKALNSPVVLDLIVNVVTVGPDFDGDWDVDQVDFGHLQECFSGTGVTQEDENCFDARLDDDDDVDQDDFAIYQRCFSGADIPADPACEN